MLLTLEPAKMISQTCDGCRELLGSHVFWGETPQLLVLCTIHRTVSVPADLWHHVHVAVSRCGASVGVAEALAIMQLHPRFCRLGGGLLC